MSENKKECFCKKNWKLPVGALLLVLFLVLIVLLKTVDVALDAETGKEIGLSSLNFAVRDAIGVHLRFYDVTEYFGYLAIALAAGFAIWAAVRFFASRFSLRKMGFDFVVLACLYAAVILFYLLFEIAVINFRPLLLDGTTPEASFPSSHTMLSIAVFVSAARILYRRFALRVSPVLFSLPFYLLAAFVTVARLLSGVHWLTDIVGGVLLASALLFLFSFFSDRVPIETDEKKEQNEEPAPAE